MKFYLYSYTETTGTTQKFLSATLLILDSHMLNTLETVILDHWFLKISGALYGPSVTSNQ